MKKIVLITLSLNFFVLTAIFSFSPKGVIAAPQKIWNARWIKCENLEPPHHANFCYPGDQWVTCENGPCGITIFD